MRVFEAYAVELFAGNVVVEGSVHQVAGDCGGELDKFAVRFRLDYPMYVAI